MSELTQQQRERMEELFPVFEQELYQYSEGELWENTANFNRQVGYIAAIKDCQPLVDALEYYVDGDYPDPRNDYYAARFDGDKAAQALAQFRGN